MLREETRAFPSQPYNERVLHRTETYNFLLLGDDSSRDITKLRHSSGPGIQFMSDLHWERFLTRRDNSIKLQIFPDALRISFWLMISAVSVTATLCKLVCNDHVRSSTRSCSFLESMSSMAPVEKKVENRGGDGPRSL